MAIKTTDSKGKRAEFLAAGWLRLKAYTLLAERFRTPVGEIDLIARRGEMLIFVEVKQRPTIESALEALQWHQQDRIRRAASIFLARNPKFSQFEARFDFIAIVPWRLPKHIIDAWR